MKSVKAVVILAGALAAAGAATPAMAQDGPGGTADEFAGVAQQIADGPLQVRPEQQPLRMVGTQDEGELSRVTEGAGHTVTQKTNGSLLRPVV